MRHFGISLVLATMLAPQAGAQSVFSVPVVAAGNALLTVSAEGKSLQAPDLAIFNAGVTPQGKTGEKRSPQTRRQWRMSSSSFAAPASPSATFRPAI